MFETPTGSLPDYEIAFLKRLWTHYQKYEKKGMRVENTNSLEVDAAINWFMRGLCTYPMPDCEKNYRPVAITDKGIREIETYLHFNHALD